MSDQGDAAAGGVADPQIRADSAMKQAEEGRRVRKRLTRTAVPTFGFTDSSRAASSGCRRERPGVKSKLQAHVEALRCKLIVSRESKMEIPDDTEYGASESERISSFPTW